MPSTDAQPAPPGRSRMLMPLYAWVVPGKTGPVLLLRLRMVSPSEVANTFACGAPRVSTDRPRSGWKVLTKSRWSPRSALFSLVDPANRKL